MDKSFTHLRPPEVYSKEGEYTHRIELTADGRRVGYVDFEYRNDPFPFYYVSMIFTRQAERGKGFGKDILQQINAFLDSKKIPGFLRDVIDPENPARGMYERNGWTPIEGKELWFGYNVPLDFSKGRVNKALHEIVEGLFRAEEKKSRQRAA